MEKNERKKIALIIRAQKEAWRREASEGKFKSYCLYWDFPFFSKRKAMFKVMDAFQYVHDVYASGGQCRIAISTPPRAGKSYITSLFCSFMLGLFPTESVMRNTCTSTLHMKLTKDVGRMLSSSKWKECFCTDASLVVNNANELRLDTAIQTSYFGAGVGGSIIGFGASMLDISDDLFKNMEDALSGVKNESVASWNDAARHSRIEKNCCSIDIGTRWTKNDTIGRNEGRYDRVISIPALDEDGNSFCEAIQTTAQYQKTKEELYANCDEITWMAEYMQQPMDIKGQLFKSSELQFYDSLPGKEEANIAVCDTADTGTDYLSSPMAKKYGHLYYIYDVVFTQLNMDFSAPLLEGALKENKVQIARFESNNGGKLFAKGIESRVPSTAFYWKVTSSNKETRILTDVFWIKKHFVFRYPYDKVLHPDGYKDGSDYDLFMRQVTSYVKGKKDQHDDAPDSLSMLRRLIDEIGYENEEKVADGEAWPSINIQPEQIIL